MAVRSVVSMILSASKQAEDKTWTCHINDVKRYIVALKYIAGEFIESCAFVTVVFMMTYPYKKSKVASSKRRKRWGIYVKREIFRQAHIISGSKSLFPHH
jgi:hypothetical protein